MSRLKTHLFDLAYNTYSNHMTYTVLPPCLKLQPYGRIEMRILLLLLLLLL